MKISVLMSTYNGEKYIEEQMDSLVNQTRAIDEIIMIDDCSTDGTVEIIRDYISKHCLGKRCKLYVNECNKGWRRNFIEGIQRTTGELLFFCDQDDIWFQNKIEIEAGILEDSDKISVVASAETLWSGDGREKEELLLSDVKCEILALDSLKKYFINCSGCTMALKKSYADKIMKYYATGWAHDDFFWKMGVMDRSFAFIQGSTILHRIHGNNESRKKRNYKSTVEGVKLDILICDRLTYYLNENQKSASGDSYQKTLEILNHKQDGNRCRLKFLESKKLTLFWKIGISYSDLYRTRKQWIGDLFLAHGYRG